MSVLLETRHLKKYFNTSGGMLHAVDVICLFFFLNSLIV